MVMNHAGRPLIVAVRRNVAQRIAHGAAIARQFNREVADRIEPPLNHQDALLCGGTAK